MIREWRGLLFLVGLTIRRQFFTKKSIVAGVLVGLIVLAVYTWSIRRVPRIYDHNDRNHVAAEEEPEEERPRRRDRDIDPEQQVLIEFTDLFVMGIYATFMMPLLCLIYATSAFADEREDRTLVYLISRPLSRWRIYLAKGIGVFPVVLLVVLGAFLLMCIVAGKPGSALFFRFLPGLAMGALAYTSLFLLFGVVAPRPLVLSVVYAFLVETLVGNMPGTLKRIAISFHTQCLLFGAGSEIGVLPENPRHLVPILPNSAMTVLWVVSAILIVWGCWIFQRREYRDLAG